MNSAETMEYLQYLNKYARYDYNLGRRESWEETVNRVVDYLMEVGGDAFAAEKANIYDAIYYHEVSPSMRLMASAGKSAQRNGVSIYNCSYLPLSTPQDFSDVTLLLGHGVGVGFSVESEFVDMWPEVPERSNTVYAFKVPDSIEGWSLSIKILIEAALEGNSVRFDYSKVRPAGSVLRTRGGHASGPEPLQEAHEHINHLLLKRGGKHLRSVDLFDIACYVASAIVVGGVRRSAMIAIFDSGDMDMLTAKTGEWWVKNPQRSYANISAVIDRMMNLEEWKAYVKLMDESKAGEPGIWSRYAIRHSLPERRVYHEYMGPNPCVEQILLPWQFCNLTQVIARPGDSFEDLERKVRLAAMIGTIQSMITNFHDINPKFKVNCEAERLLGVSISGMMDNPVLAKAGTHTFNLLRDAAIDENRKWAGLTGINASVSVTCVKPDGNTSVLYNTAPGLHARHSEFYVRRMRLQDNTPVANFVKAAGIPWEYAAHDERTIVVSFPIASPDGAAVQHERSAIEQLEWWLTVKLGYTETNPSVTVTYRPEELDDIAKWLHTHQKRTVGLSFLPHSESTYVQMPYEQIDESEYKRLAESFPDVDPDVFWLFEAPEDTGEIAQTIACAGGACEI